MQTMVNELVESVETLEELLEQHVQMMEGQDA
jgi:hypothetical protein